MPKKIATENVNAKLGIVMRSGKALLGNDNNKIRPGTNLEGHKKRIGEDGDRIKQLSQSKKIYVGILLYAQQDSDLSLYWNQHRSRGCLWKIS